MNSVELRTAYYLSMFGWALSHEEYHDSMGFLPCDALGTKVYCVRDSNGVLVGHSQISDHLAVLNAVDSVTSTHITANYAGDRHVVLKFDSRDHAFEIGRRLMSMAFECSEDDPVIVTLMADVKEVSKNA